MIQKDLVIIGAGAAGLSSALAAFQQGIADILILEKEADDKRKMSLRRTNALRVNKIPIECEFCGGDIEQSSKGGYFCVACGKENFDDFHKIRNYIEKYGPAPAVVISRNTGVSMKTIEHFRANGDVKDIRTDNFKSLW